MNLLATIFHPTSIKMVNFENVQEAIKQPNKYIIINVLPLEQQECLITGTLPAHLEEKTINGLVESGETMTKTIVLYGKNCGDYSILEKKNKLFVSLGFFKVYVYLGGLFEWLLLQDIYSAENFPTTKRVLDILHYRTSMVEF